jgi:hypothetical protein
MFKFPYKMNLECLNDIITSNLAIHIDLTNIKSWDLNTGFTSISLTKWSGAVSDNLNLIDFGLTAFDNGRTNVMWSGITLTPQDTLFSMHRIGYNVVQNPASGETSGVTVTTQFLPISAVTTGISGNYFILDGGYLQGFFKLKDYNYQLLPARYNNGITIETLLYLYPNSQGIFYMMGARAEDKYNPYFSGETMTGTTSTGVTTSLDNYLDAFHETQVVKSGFASPENMTKTVYSEVPAIDNIKNNVIAFELTQDRRLAYKYVNSDGLIVTNSSPTIVTATGFTMVAMVFTPNDIITDPDLLDCAAQRMGKLIFYINGRAVWTIKEFPEFYFKSFTNDKEKQLGVPYSISWGGGSFGLGESWHYDYQTYHIYNGENTDYINTKFFVEDDPIPTECHIVPSGDTYLAGLSLSADSSTFKYVDNCNPEIEHPITVMRIEYTGGTGTTYFIRFNQPISVISNRDYVANLSLFNRGFFNSGDGNKVSMLMYSDDVDINIISETEYVYPITSEYLQTLLSSDLHPFPDKQEYQWMVDGTMYYGATGLPVTQENALIVGYSNTTPHSLNYLASGENSWLPMRSVFRTPDNTGQNFVYLGILIETGSEFNTGGTLFINDFSYTAADILVKDQRKNDLTIEQNFDSEFIGGIQKLRIYDKAFTAPEVLHNALMEAISKPNMLVSKGGRIIFR